MVSCIVCNKTATHTCEHCTDIPYCGKECQSIDWNHIGHQLICQGFKRKRDDVLYGSAPKTTRTLRETPLRRKLPPRLLAMLDNPAFLHQWVAGMSREQIEEYISRATVGFYGALNDSNYVWYFVYYRFVKPTRLPRSNLLIRYDSRIEYKSFLY